MSAQLALYEPAPTLTRPAPTRGRREFHAPAFCAACRTREARYGFSEVGDDPSLDRPRTLCFDCFRAEVNRRQAIAARLARGWNATQTDLPLQEQLDSLRRRRGRAQIEARRVLGLR
jgi:hypothetical protein